MENRKQQILSEISEMMTSIRKQLELLDAKMAEFQHEVDPQILESEPIDLMLDDFPMGQIVDDTVDADEPELEVRQDVIEPEILEPEVVEVEVEAEPELVEPGVVEPEVMTVTEVVAVADVDDDLPFFEEPEQPQVVAEPVVSVQQKAVIDAMTARQAWRRDMPGAPVRDVRSAISLNDRVLFINMLFDEDPLAFQETLNTINQLGTLDDAVAYLAESRPSWDFESDTVYRFMMAVRRKINS